MHICKPERDVKQVHILLWASVFVTAGLFLASSLAVSLLEPIYSTAINTLGFIALTAGILLNVRYSMTEFEYIVGNGDFAIVKILGNKRQTVCCIALESAIDLMPKRDYEHLPASEKAIIKYSLNQNMKADSYIFLCNFNGKKTMIEFEPNAAFVTIMKKEIALNKKNED